MRFIIRQSRLKFYCSSLKVCTSKSSLIISQVSKPTLEIYSGLDENKSDMLPRYFYIWDSMGISLRASRQKECLTHKLHFNSNSIKGLKMSLENSMFSLKILLDQTQRLRTKRTIWISLWGRLFEVLIELNCLNFISTKNYRKCKLTIRQSNCGSQQVMKKVIDCFTCKSETLKF